MSESTARHALPFIQPAQAQKHVTHNEALERLDLLVQICVEAFNASAPPALRENAQIWALGPVPSGEWSGQDNRLAAWVNGAWVFLTPHIGWRAAQGTDLRVWSGSDWRAADLPALQNLDGLGIQTSFDATNRLAVASEATLLTHAGAGHQLKINKNEATDTASLLFQTGWSGRAEMGIAGSDTWAIKVSADGVDWRDALRADPATGQITIPEGLSVSGPLSLPAASLDLGSDAVFAGQLPLARGGTGATTAAGARTALDLGSAATAQVTTSATDTSSGRLLKVGDGGINGISPLAGNLNDNPPGGIYAYDINNGSSNGPRRIDNDQPHTRGTFISAGRFWTTQRTGLFISENWPWRGELYTRGGEVWPTDVMDTNNNSRWHRHYSTLNLLGPVSQSGGVPTGAVFQRGSNANGEFVRFADGTQICTNGNAPITTNPAAFVGPVTDIDGSKLRLGRWL